MAYWFRGVETSGVELFGWLSVEAARGLVDAPLALDENAGRVRASIFAILIEDVAVLKLPFPRVTYPEVLWLLHLRHGRLAIRAQTERRMVPVLSLVDKYNTDTAQIDVNQETLVVRSAGAGLRARFSDQGSAEPAPIERLWTRARSGRVYEIPWGVSTPQETRRLSHTIDDRSLVDEIFGPSFTLDPVALFYGNRLHACSPAKPLRG